MREICKIIKDYWASGKYIFIFNIIERLTFFAFYISIARYVEQGIYGFIVSVFSLTNIIATIFDFGIPFYVQRESATTENTKLVLSYSLFIKVISVIVFLPLPFIYFITNLNYWSIILLISLINFFLPVNQVLISYLNGKYLFKENYQSILLARIPYLLFLIFATLLKIDFHFSLITILLSLLIQNKLLIQKSGFSYVYFIKYKIDFNSIKNIIKRSLPFGLGVVFTMIYDRIDVLLIQKFLSNEAVAIYSAAYSLYRNSSILSGIILIKAYTDSSKYFIIKRKMDQKFLLDNFKILFLLSIVLVLCFNLFSEMLIRIFFTSKFIESAKILGAISFALPFLFLNNLTGVTLNSMHKEKITMFSTFFGMIVNISLNIYLIPKVGIIGAVVSTILTEMSILIFQLIYLLTLNKRYTFNE